MTHNDTDAQKLLEEQEKARQAQEASQKSSENDATYDVIGNVTELALTFPGAVVDGTIAVASGVGSVAGAILEGIGSAFD